MVKYEDKKMYLKQAFRLDELLKSKVAEIEELREVASSISSINYGKDRVDTSRRSSAKFEDIIIKIDEETKKVEKDIEDLLKIKKDIRDRIDKVKKADERLLLRLRYINYCKWEEICEEMNVSNSQVHRIHLNALKLV